MSRKLRDKERLARRNVERFRRALMSGQVRINDLLMLQRAHDHLLEVMAATADKLLCHPIARARKEGQTAEEEILMELSVSMLMYHGTTAAAAGSIVRDGIIPRGDRPPNHPDVPSHPDCTYLTDAYALFYIMAGNRDEPTGRGAVIEVDMEGLMHNLLPDEDALGPWRDPQGTIENMAEGETEFFTNVLFRSLYMNGTVAHRGIVPPGAIRRVAYVPLNSKLWLAVTTWKDTTVRALIRGQQASILHWVFDGGDKPFPVPFEELVFNAGWIEGLERVPVGSEEQAQALLARGVRADTLWRMHLMADGTLLNRQGIEVISVGGLRDIGGPTASGRACSLEASQLSPCPAI